MKASNSITRRALTALIATIMAFAMTLPVTAFASTPAAPGADYASFSVEAVNDGGAVAPEEYGQNVQITYTFDGAITSFDFATFKSSIQIIIAGYDITSDDYYRPLTLVGGGGVSENYITLNIGNVQDKSTGDKQFTAQYSGILQVSGTIAGLAVDGSSVTDLSLRTIIPVGFNHTESNQGGIAPQLTIDTMAQVRGMYHIGLYYKNTDDPTDPKLYPLWEGNDDTSPIHVKTYTAHTHTFTNQTPSDLAADIVTSISSDPAFDGVNHAITATGGTVTLWSNDRDEVLYILVFDDNLLQKLNVSYLDIVTADGVLPFAPSA